MRSLSQIGVGVPQPIKTVMEVGVSESRIVHRDDGTGIFRRQVKYNRFPSQGRFDELTTRFKGFSGPIGCIAAETVIDGTGMTVAELHRLGIAPVVQTLFGPVQATVPFIKGVDLLYRLTTKTGKSVVATGSHVIFVCGRGWRRLAAVCAGDRILASADLVTVAWDEIASITFERRDVYYDLHVPGAEHYFAHGILHHNSGKSRALCMEAIKLAYINPGVLGLLGSPTYRMLADTTLIELEGALVENKIPHRLRHSAGDMSCYLPEPDTTILLRSMENPERLRGMNLGWFGVDELSYCREESWMRLQGRLRHPKARYKCGFGVWTPKGRDWVWRMFISARKVKNFHCIQARPFENRAVLDKTPDFYENLKDQYDEKFYRQEVLGEYLDMASGSVYHSFDLANVKETEFDPKLPLILCFDFNINPMTCVLVQNHEWMGRSVVHVLREIALPKSHVIEMCNEIVRRTADWCAKLRDPLQVRVYGDATGGNPTAATQGETCWTLIESFFARQRKFDVTYLYGRSNPTVVDRVNSMNGMLCSAGDGHKDAGVRRIRISPSCTELIQDFEDVRWKVDAHDNVYPEIDKTDHSRTHLSDALGYYIHTEHSPNGSRGGVSTRGLLF